MRSRVAQTALNGVLLAAGLALPRIALAGEPADTGVRIRIQTPVAGEIVRGRFELAPFAGVASAGDEPTRFDVMLVIDVSSSTRYPSGVDVDADGKLGRREPPLVRGLPEIECSDPDDTVLAAELAAARALLGELDPERVHVGVIAFSGKADPSGESRQPESTRDAVLHQALGSDYALVRAALERIAAEGPSGGTNMAHGIRLAARELTAGEGAVSNPRAGTRKVVLLLTDGKPSLPHGSADLDDPEDIEAAAAAARAAAESGIAINVYGLGAEANEFPIAPREITRATGGLYQPVDVPGEIVAVFSGVSFANVASVVAVNLTTGQMAALEDLRLLPDGTFQGFVPVKPGVNRVRVSAFSTGGRRGSTEFSVEFRPTTRSTAELEAELEKLRARTRAILIESERQRQELYRQRERRRTLEIEADDPDGPKREKRAPR